MVRSALLLSGVALVAWLPASAQSVIAAHSGVLYFFEGSLFLGDEPLQQKFGRFPDIGVGRDLRTEHGKAEVLLTPGVVLRIGEYSAVRMLSNQLSDTRAELVGGSAILEVGESDANGAVKLIYKDWQVRMPKKGVCRIDAQPPQLRVYTGQAEVSAGSDAAVKVKEGETVPFAAVLVPEAATTTETDPFKTWAMSRSQAISADNSIAANIVDDPSKFDSADMTGLGGMMAPGGLSYFPLTGLPSLGMMNPYGLSFWSPYQSTLNSIYFPTYLYGPLYRGWPSSLYTYSRGVGIGTPLRPPAVGFRPGGIGAPRASFPTPPSMHAPPHAAAPRVGGGAHGVGGHR